MSYAQPFALADALTVEHDWADIIVDGYGHPIADGYAIAAYSQPAADGHVVVNPVRRPVVKHKRRSILASLKYRGRHHKRGK